MEPIYADLDQIVFEDREKAYGAFDLRIRYRQHLSRALLMVLILFLLITVLPKVIEWAQPQVLRSATPGGDVVVDVEWDDLPVLEDEADKVDPPPPPPEPKVPIQTIAFVVPDPTPEDQLRDTSTIHAMDDILEGNPDLFDQEGDLVAKIKWEEIEDGVGNAFTEAKPTTDEIGYKDFVFLDKEPAPVNMEDVKRLIGYPPLAVEAEIEGKVVVRVQVSTDGQYLKHVVIADPHPILTNEVAKFLSKIQFTPGIQSGKPIKVWVTIPFDFKLLH